MKTLKINLNVLDVWPLCSVIDTRISFLNSIRDTNEELFYMCLYDAEIERLRSVRDSIFRELSK